MGITKMAKGKNKQISKKGGARGKQERHPFSKKQWYKIQSPPNVHNSVQVGWTPVNKTMGTKLSKDGLLGRVCDVSYGDIQDPTNFAWKKIRMQIEEVKGSACYTSFYGINIIREKLYNYLRKRMTLIDVVADVKNNTYAKHSQVRAIRKAFVKYITRRASTSTIGDFAQNVINEDISQKLLDKGKKIYPLSHVLLRKVKVLKKAEVDVNKLIADTNAKKDESNVGKKGTENVAAEATEAKNAIA